MCRLARSIRLALACSLFLLVSRAFGETSAPTPVSRDFGGRPAPAPQIAPAGSVHSDSVAPRDLPLAMATTLAWQIALESWGFSPGLLDGEMGRKTRLAIAAAQASLGAPVTGEHDERTERALGVRPDKLLTTYQITADDERQLEDLPRDWNEKSRKHRLSYPDLLDLISEKFHTTQGLLSRLNEGVDLATLTAGIRLHVPARRAFENRENPELSFLEIDLDRRIILLIRVDATGAQFIAGLLHCSVAKDLSQAPLGENRVLSVIKNPDYTFNPEKWPEIDNVFQTLNIPPGPRNPVGVRWIALNRRGYGIHGTPKPENIGRTGSHGCIRLTNWDAIWLGSVVSPGIPVRVYRWPAETTWSWNG